MGERKTREAVKQPAFVCLPLAYKKTTKRAERVAMPHQAPKFGRSPVVLPLLLQFTTFTSQCHILIGTPLNAESAFPNSLTDTGRPAAMQSQMCRRVVHLAGATCGSGVVIYVVVETNKLKHGRATHAFIALCMLLPDEGQHVAWTRTARLRFAIGGPAGIRKAAKTFPRTFRTFRYFWVTFS